VKNSVTTRITDWLSGVLGSIAKKAESLPQIASIAQGV